MSANERETATGKTETREVGKTVGVGESKEDSALRGVSTALGSRQFVHLSKGMDGV